MSNIKIISLSVVAVLALATAGGILLLENDRDADIVIACGTKNCYEPFWIAEEKNLFEKYGVKVEMKYVNGGGNAMTTLLSGQTDLTLVGADPAIRMFETYNGGYAIGTVMTAKSGEYAADLAYLNDRGIDIGDASTFLTDDGNSVRVKCGLDTTTGYYSGYLGYLYDQKEQGNITEAQYLMLRETGKGIIHIDFENQVASLLNGDVQIICGGNNIHIAGEYPNVSTGSPSFDSVIGGCIIVASVDAYENKWNDLVKVMKALDDACALIEDPATADEISQFCADYYGAAGWNKQSQKEFFAANYWDICTMSEMVHYLEYKAELIDPAYAGHDYSNLVKTDIVKKTHEGIPRYDGKYIYIPGTGLVEDV